MPVKTINPQQEDSIQNLKKLSEIRELRAKEVLMVGKPQLLSEEEFLVPSSNGKDNYRVIHLDSWSCNCPDFINRCKRLNIYCKHIKALQIFLKLRNSNQIQDFDILQIAQEEDNCPYCNSNNKSKQGFRINKNGKKQKFKCLGCNKNFIIDPIKHHKATAKIITLTMDLYYKGLSLRDITDTLKQFYNINLHHETVRRWIRKFCKIMNDYTDKLNPNLELGDNWYVDEQVVKVNKNKNERWVWNMIDGKTRFLIANNVTKERSIKDARKVFKKAKEVTNQEPLTISSDGLQSYIKSIKKEYPNKKDRFNRVVSGTEHIRNAGISKKENNNMVERYHNEFREFDKIRRNFKRVKTLEEWNENYRLYHNFIRQHMALNNLTPSQVANINLPLENNRWLSLLKESMKK